VILQKLKTLPPSVRRAGIFAGWAAGLILISALLWGLTLPVRNRALLNSVNRVLNTLGEEARLETPLPSWGMPGRAAQSGSWFTAAGSVDWAVVFTAGAVGVFTPFLAFVSPDGKAGPLIPLSRHAEAVSQRLPPGQLRIYVRRIEASHALLRKAREDKEDTQE
jgi:hypothetical protein